MHRRTRPHIPWVVEQYNVLTLVFVEVFCAGVFLAVLKLYQEPAGVIVGLGFAFLPLLFAYAFAPYNPYRGMGGHIEGGKLGRVAVSQRERRLWMAFYDPKNRRRAAIMVGGALALWLSLWQLGVRFWPAPLHPEPLLHTAALTFVPGVVSAAFAGMFGLTTSIRAQWPEIVETGPGWPETPRYPGPFRDSVTSFFVGDAPRFLPAGQDGKPLNDGSEGSRE